MFNSRPSYINCLPTFHGMASEEPYSHLSDFGAICSSIGDGTYDQEEVRLRLFQFSLKDKAKHWFNSLPVNSIRDWAEMQQLFLNEYYSQAKTDDARIEIRHFQQQSGELFHEAFTRFKELLRKCPHHQIELWEQIKYFVDGLTSEERKHLKASSGGQLLNQPEEDDWEFLELMCQDSKAEASAERRRKQSTTKSVKSAMSAEDRIAALEKELLMYKKDKKKDVGKVGVKFPVCEDCGEIGHKAENCPEYEEEECPEEVNYAYGDSKGQGYNSNTYHPGLRNHPNFSYGNATNQSNPNFQGASQNRQQNSYNQGGNRGYNRENYQNNSSGGYKQQQES